MLGTFVGMKPTSAFEMRFTILSWKSKLLHYTTCSNILRNSSSFFR